MGDGLKKEYRLLPGAFDEDGNPMTVLGAAVMAFALNPRISFIVVVHPLDAESGEYAARAALGARILSTKKQILFVPGGKSRQSSVYNGLSFLQTWKPDITLIHDGARPWIKNDLIDRIIDGVIEYGAAIPVVPLTETPKIINPPFIEQHLKRTTVFAAQTPQGFLFSEILAAHQKAAEHSVRENAAYTDDAEIYGAFAGKTAAIQGDRANIKITFAFDLQTIDPPAAANPA